jgi:hypothetical protein
MPIYCLPSFGLALILFPFLLAGDGLHLAEGCDPGIKQPGEGSSQNNAHFTLHEQASTNRNSAARFCDAR